MRRTGWGERMGGCDRMKRGDPLIWLAERMISEYVFPCYYYVVALGQHLWTGDMRRCFLSLAAMALLVVSLAVLSTGRYLARSLVAEESSCTLRASWDPPRRLPKMRHLEQQIHTSHRSNLGRPKVVSACTVLRTVLPPTSLP